MRFPTTSGILLTAGVLSASTANPLPQSNIETSLSLERRAFSNAPDGYAPGEVKCPDVPLLRSAKNISDGEQEFVKKRHEQTNKALSQLLKRVGMTDFDVDSFLSSYSPTVGIAFSGGGYRAMLSGAGAIKAIDSRESGTTDGPGTLGGLLQGSTYFAGLSGGSWLLGSVIVNNYTTISELQKRDDLWELENSILTPEGSLKIISNIDYWTDIRDDVKAKKEAGFDVSLTDYWGRALSHQFVGVEDGGPGVTWSSIALTDHYKNADIPFPLVVADGRNPGEQLISANTTVYEFNPLEFGSFDPQLFTFTPIEYMGSNVTNGIPVKKDVCVRGFDNAGFIMGTSSSLFNQIMFNLPADNLPSAIVDIAESFLAGLSESDADIADYSPNPFYGVNPSRNPSANTRDLTLVDGGEDLQNIPLHPLIQPTRKVDVIFAFDNSGDTIAEDGINYTSWPNGTALLATYERSLMPTIANGTVFPAIPDTNTFVNLGLNNRPTFFGCESKNFTQGATIPPLIVYIPNAPWVYHSNTTTLTMKYDNTQRDNMILNGQEIATQGNDAEWTKCVACAVVHRELERRDVTPTQQCQQCLKKFCWDGTLRPETPEKVYDPEYKGTEIKSAAGRVGVRVGAVVAAAVVALVVV
ncbi:lysophospholipase [Ascodesmis nigricans]|uniref:Lysophospholipase n=1 Tax=Ascodesmis nigricans TaxID=341454 RepID=A0A4S2MKK9_9PEZI|nr:lysophospholipase [Ascodesmis nigricans]